MSAADAELPVARGRGNARSFGVSPIYLVVAVLVVVLIGTPLVALVLGSFRSGSPGQEGAWTLRNWAGVFTEDVARTFVNTLELAVLTAVLSTALGAIFAWLVCRTDFPFKRGFTLSVAMSLAFPGFILAMAWIILGSPGGMANALLRAVFHLTAPPVDIYSLGGMVWVMMLHLAPVAFFSLRGPLTSMDSSLEEAAASCGAGAWKTVIRVTGPLMTFPLLSSLLLTFVLSVEQFAIPALIGIPGHINVLATELYLLVNFEPPQPGLAAAIGLSLTIITSLALYLQRRITARVNATTIGGKGGRPRLTHLGSLRWLATGACLAYLLLAFVLPVLALIYTSIIKYPVANPLVARYTLRAYSDLIADSGIALAFWNTLWVAGGGALLALTLGGLLAFFAQRLRARGGAQLEALASLAFGVPGVVVGLGFLWSFVYLPIYGTLLALILCYVSRFLPYATETVGAQLRQVDRSLDEAAAVSGAAPTTVARRILIPLLRSALESGFLLLFITFFREIAAATLLYTPDTEVVSITIWTYFENADWGRASALSLVALLLMLMISAGVLAKRDRS